MAIEESNVLDARDRVLDLESGIDARAAAMLRIWRRHWWSEVVYDIDTCMDTLSDDVTYRSYGAATFGEDIAIDGATQARAMYEGMFGLGLMPGGPFDGEKFAFAPWGLTMEATYTAVYPGGMMPGLTGLDADGLYKIRWQMMVSHRIDLEAGTMGSEIMYPGPPISVRPSHRQEIARLLSRDEFGNMPATFATNV